jgi:hypothetical protein
MRTVEVAIAVDDLRSRERIGYIFSPAKPVFVPLRRISSLRPWEEVAKPRVFYELIESRQREHFSFRAKKQLPHVFAANSKSSPINASHDFESRQSFPNPLVPHGREPFDTRRFVTGCAVVSGDLGFDDHGRIDFVRDDEVRSLSEPRYSLRSFGLPKRDP